MTVPRLFPAKKLGKITFIIVFIILYIKVNAQNTIKIEYKQKYIGEQPKDITYWGNGSTTITKSDIELPKVRMLVNDTIAHIHYFRRGFDPLKKRKKVFGDKIVHHGIFLDFLNLNFYDESSLSDLPNYLIKKTCGDTLNWVILSKNNKIILGYKCIAALAINSKNDSVLVYFTNDFKSKKGFLFYEGVPGIVLESFDQRYGDGRHFEATKIEEVELELKSPKCDNIISCEDYQVLMKNRNEHLGGNLFIRKTSTTTIRQY
jgi:GLPGLI family protein